MSDPAASADGAPVRRRYESPVRRRQLAQTRERIVAAGSAVVHSLPTWDWGDLTFRAVAERAGVSERTVYRHFATERALHDAVMQRLTEEAGVAYGGLSLDGVADSAARVFAALSSFTASPWAMGEMDDPTFVSLDEVRRRSLLDAVTRSSSGWSAADRETVAGVLDVLWSVPSFERLVAQWRLDPDRATAAIGWVIGLVVDAVRSGKPPEI
jgi:AcrR family transcriptional regulator